VKTAMGRFNDLVERRIRSAMAEGAFDDLPGQGQPLVLDDDALVPEELRVAHRVLKNAGYVPEALELRREIADIQRVLDRIMDGDSRRRANRRMALLRTRLAACVGERPVHLDGEYRERVLSRLEGVLPQEEGSNVAPRRLG